MKQERFSIFLLVVTIIITVSTSIIVFSILYKTPATEEDFKSLKDQISEIQEHPNSLAETKGTIELNGDGTFTIILKNEKCKVSKTLNAKTFESISDFTETDLSKSVFTYLMMSISMSVIMGGLFYMLCDVINHFMILCSIERNKKKKRKN